MGRPRNIVDSSSEPETPVHDEGSITSAVVQDSRGQTIRVYDLATHGKDFEELAQTFASHHLGSTVVAH